MRLSARRGARGCLPSSQTVHGPVGLTSKSDRDMSGNRMLDRRRTSPLGTYFPGMGAVESVLVGAATVGLDNFKAESELSPRRIGKPPISGNSKVYNLASSGSTPGLTEVGERARVGEGLSPSRCLRPVGLGSVRTLPSLKGSYPLKGVRFRRVLTGAYDRRSLST